MRKIAANYILLPGFEFVKNGYVVLKDGRVEEVVNTGGQSMKFLVLNSMGGCLLTIVCGKIWCGFRGIVFVTRFLNCIKITYFVGMGLLSFKGLILQISSGHRKPGLYICAKVKYQK